MQVFEKNTKKKKVRGDSIRKNRLMWSNILEMEMDELWEVFFSAERTVCSSMSWGNEFQRRLIYGKGNQHGFFHVVTIVKVGVSAQLFL